MFSDECLVWQLCVRYLDLCSDPYVAADVCSEPPTNVCSQPLLRWVVGVLLQCPAWLQGDCECHVALLATLVILTHRQVCYLITGPSHTTYYCIQLNVLKTTYSILFIIRNF